jgi:hypothetical protein
LSVLETATSQQTFDASKVHCRIVVGERVLLLFVDQKIRRPFRGKRSNVRH